MLCNPPDATRLLSPRPRVLELPFWSNQRVTHIGQGNNLECNLGIDVGIRVAQNPKHVAWLKNTNQQYTSACGQIIEVWELDHKVDETILTEWAQHFRQNYILDEDLSEMVDGTGLSVAEYLRDQIFPDASKAPGPSVRSGDFGELLVADYLEYHLNYWYPRSLRYQDRWNRNDSTKGCDIIAFKFVSANPGHPDDELVVFEAKSGMTESEKNRLQDAIDDSIKDAYREAMSLNAIKQRFKVRGEQNNLKKVQRFQNQTAIPFKKISGAAAILDDSVFTSTVLTTVDASNHPNKGMLRLIVIRGPSLMKLVHALYERAANAA